MSTFSCGSTNGSPATASEPGAPSYKQVQWMTNYLELVNLLELVANLPCEFSRNPVKLKDVINRINHVLSTELPMSSEQRLQLEIGRTSLMQAWLQRRTSLNPVRCFSEVAEALTQEDPQDKYPDWYQSDEKTNKFEQLLDPPISQKVLDLVNVQPTLFPRDIDQLKCEIEEIKRSQRDSQEHKIFLEEALSSRQCHLDQILKSQEASLEAVLREVASLRSWVSTLEERLRLQEQRNSRLEQQLADKPQPKRVNQPTRLAMAPPTATAPRDSTRTCAVIGVIAKIKIRTVLLQPSWKAYMPQRS